jgi:hypothetical protein
MTEQDQQQTVANGAEAHEEVNGYLLPILVPPTPPYGTGFPTPPALGGGTLQGGRYWPVDLRTADPIVQFPERCAE